MACQSMLIVLVGAVPEYHKQPVTEAGDTTKGVAFTEDVSSIVTEVMMFFFVSFHKMNVCF